MACRCAPSPRVILPFLYPALFSANGTHAARVRLAVTGARRSSSEATSPSSTSRLNPAPDDFSQPYFADKAKLELYAGPGGNGCISFRREAYMEDGPPNGGDGGHGGNVYIQAVRGESSLHKLTRRRFIRAGRGKNGQGSNRGGMRGDDIVITVPVGTVVTELSRTNPEQDDAFLDSRRAQMQESNTPEEVTEEDLADERKRQKWILYPGISSSEAKKIVVPELPPRDRLYYQPRGPIRLDLSKPTPRPILLAVGGIGGLGNPHFVSRERRKPMFATKGEQAISMQIELELKLLADIGLVGLPNAGKSTLLRALTNSRTRVGNWAFTTLQPNIGTVVLDNNKGRPVLTSFRRSDDPRTTDVDSLTGEPTSDLVRRTRFTIADIPGLIEGAHLDKGLGIEFLRHVERAGVLAFVIDLGAGDAVKALKALWNEVGLYAQMREDEEKAREAEARVDWSAGAGTDVVPDDYFPLSGQILAEVPEEPEPAGLDIAAKPWFVVASKGDLPGAQANFKELRAYLDAVTRGDEPHPSGVEGAWTKDCTAIPVSAINGQGVDRIIHWSVGLMDG